MTAAMRRALDWLRGQGGSGVVDHHNRVLAGGEVAHQFDAGTWLRLAIEGLVKLENKRITVDAATAVKKVEKE